MKDQTSLVESKQVQACIVQKASDVRLAWYLFTSGHCIFTFANLQKLVRCKLEVFNLEELMRETCWLHARMDTDKTCSSGFETGQWWSITHSNSQWAIILSPTSSSTSYNAPLPSDKVALHIDPLGHCLVHLREVSLQVFHTRYVLHLRFDPISWWLIGAAKASGLRIA